VSAEQIKGSEKSVYQKQHKILANKFNEYIGYLWKTAADKVKRLAEVNKIQTDNNCFTTFEKKNFK
jgi:dsDNA-specific endonuclease/ATPase MutS2